MSDKSKQLLRFACLAMIAALALRFVPAHWAHDAGDFATGMGAALMIGVAIMWKRGRPRQA